MNTRKLVQLGLKHAHNRIAEFVRIRTHNDYTKPVTFIGHINERCNVKCRQCEYWRLPHYKEEMTIEEWKRALLSIKDFVGNFSITFTGGEPYIRKGFLDLVTFGGQKGISCSIISSGSCMTKEISERTVAARPFSVHISVDAPNAALHDYLRGQPGLFSRLSDGITHMRREQDKQGVRFPIVVKPTLNRLNFRLMPELVKWSAGIGATAVHFQPVTLWSPETRNELWVEEEDHAELAEVIENLAGMKRVGYPISPTEEILRLFVSHFRKESAPEQFRPCRVGLRNFWIDANGDVMICDQYPVVGNIRDQEAREIWYGDRAQNIRQLTLSCSNLCVLTCNSRKSLKNQISMGLHYLRS